MQSVELFQKQFGCCRYLFPPSSSSVSHEPVLSWATRLANKVRNETAAQPRPLECVQSAGDVVFLPGGWVRANKLHFIVFLLFFIRIAHCNSDEGTRNSQFGREHRFCGRMGRSRGVAVIDQAPRTEEEGVNIARMGWNQRHVENGTLHVYRIGG